MSNSIKALLALGLITLVGACAQQQAEEVVYEPEPITMEPEPTGKYGGKY